MSNAPKTLAPCDHDECGLTECRLVGGSDQRLVRLIALSRNVVKTSDEPECGCEYQHERCAAMDYRNAVRELESFIKEIEPNSQLYHQ